MVGIALKSENYTALLMARFLNHERVCLSTRRKTGYFPDLEARKERIGTGEIEGGHARNI